MNRRGFFKRLLATVAVGATMDPEELLWTRKKLISIPKPAPTPIMFAGNVVVVNQRQHPSRIGFLNMGDFRRIILSDDPKETTISDGVLSADGQRMEFTLTPPPFRLLHIQRSRS